MSLSLSLSFSLSLLRATFPISVSRFFVLSLTLLISRSLRNYLSFSLRSCRPSRFPVHFLLSSLFSRSALVLVSPPPPPSRAPSLLSFFARFAFQSISRCKLELYGCERWMRREFIYAIASCVPESCMEASTTDRVIIDVKSRSNQINFISLFAGF